MSSRRTPERLLWLGLLMAPGLFFAACESTPPAPATEANDTALAAAFFADPPLAHVRLSPNGERIVGIGSHDGIHVLIEKALRGDEVRFLGKFGGLERVVHDLGWVGDGKVAILLEADSGHGASLPLDVIVFNPARWRPSRTDIPWRLPASPRATRSSVLNWLPEDPERWIVSWFDAESGSSSVRALRVRNGTGEVVSPEGFAAHRWFVDARGAARAALVEDEESLFDVVYVRANAEEPMRPLADEGFTREENLAFAGFTPDPKEVFVYATTEAGRRGLFRYDLTRGERVEQVVADARYDVGPLHYQPGTDRLRSVEIAGERPEFVPVGDGFAAELAAFEATFPGAISRVFASDRDGEVNLVQVSSPTLPPHLYVYERSKREMEILYAALPKLADATLPPMHAVSYPARDGLEIPAYLTLPPDVTLERARNLPVIVIAHDGPTRRVTWGWDARAAFLATRGFAVLQPNFRGSDGYGRAFERAGYVEWGGAMENDLVDGVAWLVERGIADPDRVGVFGSGYGGYAALVAPVVAPGVFRAVASWGGISDLAALLDDRAAGSRGDPNHPTEWATERDRARLVEISPRHRAKSISVPVLLAHGRDDRRVPFSHSETLAEALEEAGVRVEQRWYRGEGHELRAEENRIGFHDALADFFERNLASRDAL